MKKRTFLKLSASAMTGIALSPLAAFTPQERLKNWAGNLTYSTSNVDYPKTLDEVQKLVKQHKKMKVLGTRHCFNNIADSTTQLVSTKNLDEVVSLNKDAKTITVGAGVRYGQVAEYLYKNGYALHNLASLPHISVAGACATGTHGSGNKNGNLSTALSAMEMVTASGDVVYLSRVKDGADFSAAVVGLGALGMVTKVTLDIQPAFEVRQNVYENLPFDHVKGHFDEIFGSGYSVSFFTDWQNKNFSEVWVKHRMDAGTVAAPSEFFGAKAATKNLHPIVALSAENCTEQMGVPGPWHERLPHFKMGFTPSSGKELQSEFYVPREHAFDAILAVEKLHKQITPHLFITEIRTIDRDDLWMSPCYRQASATIHFTWKQETPEVMKLIPQIEAALAPFNPRPHWGKLFTLSAKHLEAVYPKMKEFRELAKHYDPTGKFHNAFLNRNIFSV